ncbi:MAG: inositol monophosphatase family protein [Bacteroidota bacterium]
MEASEGQLKTYCLKARQVVAQVAGFIQQELGKVAAADIITKDVNSLVSYVDRQAEEQLVEALGAILPQATFLTEEETVKSHRGEWQWIIDPLDGTTNFLHGLPFFSISVALQHQNQMVLGIVYEVNRSECFYAWKGGGAWLNDRPIQVSQNPLLQDALIATGFPYYDYSQMANYLSVFQQLMRQTRGIRRFGSAALDLAYVACGRFDAYFEYGLNPWDVAAGLLIIAEAGGQLSDFQGGETHWQGKSVIASSKALFPQFSGPIQLAFAE